MIFASRAVMALMILCLPAGALAQVCGVAGATACDDSYRKLQPKCDDKYGTLPPCPKDAMPMKTTGTAPQSLIKDFNPYLFAYARDKDDNTRPYDGPLSTGTFGNSSQTFQLIGNATKDKNSGQVTNRQDSCINQIQATTDDPAEQAKIVRMQLDNCTNQYLLHTAVSPEYRKKPTLPSGENPNDPTELISMKTYCQPLATKPPPQPEEYKASDYLKVGWQKTMVNPSAQKTHAAFAVPAVHLPPIIQQIFSLVMRVLVRGFPQMSYVTEPKLPSGTTLQNASDPAVQPPSNFPDVSQMQIASSQEGTGSNYEMILDPTHPYSPRWDYFYNDRSLSHLTSAYQSDTENAVYCAGTRGTSQIKAIAQKLGTLNPTQLASVMNPSALASTLTPTQLGTIVDPAKLAAMDPTQKINSIDPSKLAAMEPAQLGTILKTATTATGTGATTGTTTGTGAGAETAATAATIKQLTTLNPTMPANVAGQLATLSNPTSLVGQVDPTKFAGLPAGQQASVLNADTLGSVLNPNGLAAMDKTELAQAVDMDKLNAMTGNAFVGDGKNYKVDILEFRRPAFEKHLVNGRIGYNAMCYADSNAAASLLGLPVVGSETAIAATSFCYFGTVVAHRVPCWQCYGLAPGVKTDDRTSFAPCATRYDRKLFVQNGLPQADLRIRPGYHPGLLNQLKRTASCSLDFGNVLEPKTEIDEVCKVARRPFVPINVLKMRYHPVPDSTTSAADKATMKAKDELPAGVPEGYSFKEYFGDHMPYPRIWDTGGSIMQGGGTNAEQGPMDTAGQYTAIVGVGREKGATGNASGMNANDERCMYGGWGAAGTAGGMTIKVPDPITSWTELKLYQARTTREKNLVCLGRYEKVFKPRSSEGQILLLGSGKKHYTRICKKGANGIPTCREYAANKQGPDKDETAEVEETSRVPAWRGYMSDGTAAQQFPNFGGTANKGVHTGLDDVRCQDIIIMPKGPGDTNAVGLPKLALVVGIHTAKHGTCQKKGDTADHPSDCESTKDCYIKVAEPDNGKWPDACGSTEIAGPVQTRTFYKTGQFPQSYTNMITDTGWKTHGCEDPGLSSCELSSWSTLKFYRPSEDKRTGN